MPVRYTGSFGRWSSEAPLRSGWPTSGSWVSSARKDASTRLERSQSRQRWNFAADSFDSPRSATSWAPVATLPSELRALLHPPPLRQTAGVFLELVDQARVEVRLAAPFIDPEAVHFLTDSLISAGRRGVDVRVVTSIGQASRFAEMAQLWPAGGDGRLRVTEVQTQLSPLGSHAKALVADGERGYIGSANLTAAGLGRHVELGVELVGPQLAELIKILEALERVGTQVLRAGRGMPC